ncbi:hypothetical protein GGX14DRAFT_378862 [Mycena pura]|uniref:Uncharacterized protein n=1 Tax=Mycena pura TaxID=153505 RepID=A0AAD6US74_9AGAR|nr:hypothetical protein GGX14DRAFT_378862 [Mycena pura]
MRALWAKDAEKIGSATCPDCNRVLKYGPGGLINLEKTHKGTQVCIDLKKKIDKAAAARKTTTISNFFHKKAPPVPSTVQAPSLIQSTSSNATAISENPTITGINPTITGIILPAASTVAKLSVSPTNTSADISPRLIDLIHQLREGARRLPATIPEADHNNPLSLFAGDPALYVGEAVKAEDLWEALESNFHKAFGYGMSPESRECMIQPGLQGIGGFCSFLEYFVIKRGLRGGMVELKVEQLLDAMNIVLKKHGTATSDPGKLTKNSIIVVDSDSETEIPSIPAKAAPHPPPVAPQCTGFIFPFGSNYPFGLHDTITFPWSFTSSHGTVILRSYDCTRSPIAGRPTCDPCATVPREPALAGILDRAEHGIPENAKYAYYSFSGLTELLRRKNQRIQELHLRGLNTARKLLSQARSLSDYKRLVRAIGSGVAQNVDRLIRVALRQKRGIRVILRLHDDAARGVYHPKDYTEEDDLRGVLIWKMGGNRLADLAHRALGLPGRTTLRNRLIVPPITPSPGAPQVSEVAQNVDACFAGITDVVAAKKVVHQILLFDELATEKRIRWDDKTNSFIGVCRQHASKISLQFNSEHDLEELFRALEKTETHAAEVHYAGEATVAAIGILSDDTRLYAARPILVSGDCKKETGKEHARNLIQPVVKGVNSKQVLTKLRIVSIASDGESRRGAAFIDMTFIRKLSPQSNIYHLLKDLPLMDLWVGEDDLTPDKDPKHVFKRLRNRLLRPSGTEVMGTHISTSINRSHLLFAGHSAQHLNSLFNPEDKQNVKVAFELLKDMWTLPPPTSDARPGVIAARIGLRTLGTLFYHLVFPYICVDLTLSEQLEHLSAAAHLALLLYRDGGKKALPTLLFTDIMLIVKNAYFCVAKAKVDDPDGNFWLILLGTDRLEQLFGILRTMIGNDRNLDILQLVERITGSTEIANIFAKYPHWDRPPRRLSLPALTRDSKELPDKVDHIRPPSWRGDTAVRNATPQTTWRRGRRMLAEELPHLGPAFNSLDTAVATNPDINILSPHGTLITKVKLDTDDNEDDDEPAAPGETAVTPSVPIDLEDAIVEEEEREVTPTKPVVSHFITVGNSDNTKTLRKSRALSLMQKYRHTAASTDRLRRVADVERFSPAGDVDIAEFDSTFGAPSILVSEPIVTLVRCEEKLFVCIGEVTDIRVDAKSVEQVALEALLEQAATVSFQILRVIPATADDDPTLKNDWVSGSSVRTVLASPGRLVLPIDPTLSTRIPGKPCYLFESSVLRAFGARLMDSITPHANRLIPKFTPTEHFPYRESQGAFPLFHVEIGPNVYI